MSSNETPRVGLIAASFSCLLQGSWAIYANHAYGLSKSLLAGGTQGASSFCSTLIFTILIENLLKFFDGIKPIFRLLFTSAIAISSLTVALLVIHWIASTPNPYLTIALPVGIGSLYCTVYCYIRTQRKLHS